MAFTRRHSRFDVRFADQISARLSHAKGIFRLVTFGGGGCAFEGKSEMSQYSPPQDFPISLAFYENDKCLYNRELKGTLIYVRPNNMTHDWLFGFSFATADQSSVTPVVSKLESLVQRGLIDRA